MKRFKKLISSLTLVLLTGLALNFNGCMDQSSLSPEPSEGGFKILKVKHPRLMKAFQQSKLIDGSGGTLSVGDEMHGISKLVIPANAVGNEVLITFSMESTDLLEAQFSPHGITFDQPVRLELSYKDADLTGVNEDGLKIYYYNQDSGAWELVGEQVDKTKKVVVGYTNHFSRYAVAFGE